MEIVCPACNQKMQSAKDLSGRTVKCKCGHSFRVPSQPANPSGKITLKCECGKTLAVPASAAGKQAKCTCGRILNVPGPKAQPARAAQPAAKAQSMARAQQAAPSPLAGAFDSISEDEWSKLTVDTAPKKADPYADLLPPEEEEEKRTAADEIMDRAREEMGESKDGQKDQAVSQLSSARWLLVFVGAVAIGFGVFGWYSFAEDLKALEALQVDGIDTIVLIVKVLIGVQIGVGVTFCLFGALIFVFPLTCTISALVLYVSLQIFTLVMNPLALARISGWIVRIAICSSLIKAVNNAAYYNYLKKQQSQKGRKQVGY